MVKCFLGNCASAATHSVPSGMNPNTPVCETHWKLTAGQQPGAQPFTCASCEKRVCGRYPNSSSAGPVCDMCNVAVVAARMAFAGGATYSSFEVANRMDGATYASCEVANRMLCKRSDLTEDQRRALAQETVDRVYQPGTWAQYAALKALCSAPGCDKVPTSK
jgi:hypothetical protein